MLAVRVHFLNAVQRARNGIEGAGRVEMRGRGVIRPGDGHRRDAIVGRYVEHPELEDQPGHHVLEMESRGERGHACRIQGPVGVGQVLLRVHQVLLLGSLEGDARRADRRRINFLGPGSIRIQVGRLAVSPLQKDKGRSVGGIQRARRSRSDIVIEPFPAHLFRPRIIDAGLEGSEVGRRVFMDTGEDSVIAAIGEIRQRLGRLGVSIQGDADVHGRFPKRSVGPRVLGTSPGGQRNEAQPEQQSMDTGLSHS